VAFAVGLEGAGVFFRVFAFPAVFAATFRFAAMVSVG
jgi:hypothetical protein